MSNPFTTVGPKIVGGVISRFQDQERQSEDKANKAIGDIAGGVFLEDVSVDNTGFTKVSHKLGRKWKGFFKADDDAGVSLFTQRVADDTLFIELQATAAATVSIWVF